jgi:hypothetical protein
VTGQAGVVYLLHFDRLYVPYPAAPPGACAGHYTGFAAGPRALARRLEQHGTSRGARLMLAVAQAGITWQLARTWPGTRTRERQLKTQGGAARRCPLCGITPRPGDLPRNADGRVSRSLTSDSQKAAAGLMTAAQLAEHTALRRGLITGKPARPVEHERGPLPDDPWAIRPGWPAPALASGGIL